MENPGFPGVKAEVNCLIKIVGYQKYSDEYACIPKIGIHSKKGLKELSSGVCKWLPNRHNSLGGTKMHSCIRKRVRSLNFSGITNVRIHYLMTGRDKGAKFLLLVVHIERHQMIMYPC